jgi:hypothetical protein
VEKEKYLSFWWQSKRFNCETHGRTVSVSADVSGLQCGQCHLIVTGIQVSSDVLNYFLNSSSIMVHCFHSRSKFFCSDKIIWYCHFIKNNHNISLFVPLLFLNSS